MNGIARGANEFLYPPLAEPLRGTHWKGSPKPCSKGGAGNSGELGKVAASAFFSARGGCGATTFAIHVASHLSKAEQTSCMLVAVISILTLRACLRFLMKSKNTYLWFGDALDNLHRMDLQSVERARIQPPEPDRLHYPAPDEVAAKRHPGREEMTHLLRFIRSDVSRSRRRFRPQRQHGGPRFPALSWTHSI